MAFNPFTCPAAAALTALPDNTCPENFDQIVRAGIKRKGGSALFTVSGASPTIKTSSAWAAAMADTDDGKMILTPKFGGLTFPKAEPKWEGENDNLYPDGAGYLVPGDPIMVRMTFTGKSAALQTALDKLYAERGGLELFLINRFGMIWCKDDGFGFDVLSAGTTDMGSDGLNKPNQFDLILKLPFGWSRGFAGYTPSFDILTFTGS